MAEPEIIPEKKDFTVVTNAGKKVVTNLTTALKNDSSAELMTVIKTWVPELLNTVLDVVFTKAKIWDRIDNDAQLDHLRELDFKSIFDKMAPNQPNTRPEMNPSGFNSEMFQMVHRSMVALEASQMTVLDKLNSALAAEPAHQQDDKWDRHRQKINTSFHFVQKYGDKVRT